MLALHRWKRTVLATALVAITVAVPGARAADGMAPLDIARLRSVNEVAVSPDGRHEAYVLGVPRDPFEEEDGKAWAELHVVDAAGRSRPFVTGEVNVDAIAWTPDGRGISFLAKRGSDEHESLYVIPVDGGEARRVLAHAADIGHYDWSPDGRRLAFAAPEGEDTQTKKFEEKGFDQEVFEENWRPVRVWIAEVKDGAAATPRALDLQGSAHELHWGPGGKRIAVALAPTPLVDDRYMKRRIHVVDADSGEVKARVENPGKLGDFRWSPDGGYLAMISGVDIHDPSEGRLMIASAQGGAPRDVVPAYPGHIRSFAWQDANSLVFVADVGVWTTVERIDFLGERRSGLVSKGGPVLSDVSLSANGEVAAFLGESPQHPDEVFRMQVGAHGPARLTDSNPWLAELELSQQEVVRYKARDGVEIEGILVHPLGREAGRRYPLVMIVHGGPESHHRNGWQTSYSRPAQVLAARGFAVFFTNYRGSTGRGVEFSTLSQGDFAGREFDDLVDAVDHLIERGLVDKNRVGVTGGSYGGYATAWLSTRYTDRFAAGVMSVGISNLFSKVGTSDIPNELYQVHMRKHIWDDWDLMLERSPIRYVEQARTPLLILHGKKDTRVFPGQSMELYRYLKTLGNVPVRLVFYPREGHGNRRAPARLDYSLRLLRWMEHYLLGPGGDPPPYETDYGWQPEAAEGDEG